MTVPTVTGVTTSDQCDRAQDTPCRLRSVCPLNFPLNFPLTLYTPLQGRWMSPDPYSGSYDTGNPQSYNRYSYALNNPVGMTDPSGLFTNGAYCGDSCSGGGGDGAFINLFVDFGEAIAGLFGRGPSFHGTLSPRASTGNSGWDGNFGESLGIPTSIPRGNLGLGMALGLPSQGCDFGPCGGGAGFGQNPQGVPSNVTITIPPEVWVWAQNQRQPVSHIGWWHGNWCGVGGSGLPTDDADASCLLHDYCYNVNALTPESNWLGASNRKAAAIQACNQQLCDNEWFSGGTVPSATVQLFFTFYGITGGRYGCNGKGPGF
jgi:hypothetical protein